MINDNAMRCGTMQNENTEISEQLKDLSEIFSKELFLGWPSDRNGTRVAASERNSVGTPLVWRRRNQFCDLVPIRRIGSKSYFEIPFQSNSSSVFDLFFYAVQCVIYFYNLLCIIGHIK